MHLGATPTIFKNAYALRINPTKAEEILWGYLRDRQMEGVKFRRQHPIRKYAADFFANEIKLIIELDGKHHDHPNQKLSDEERTEILKILSERRITFLRFKNEQVYDSIEEVLDQIKKTIIELRKRKKQDALPGVFEMSE